MAPVGGVQIIVDAYLTLWKIKMATDIDSRISRSLFFLSRKKIKNLRLLFRVEKAVGVNAFSHKITRRRVGCSNNLYTHLTYNTFISDYLCHQFFTRKKKGGEHGWQYELEFYISPIILEFFITVY